MSRQEFGELDLAKFPIVASRAIDQCQQALGAAAELLEEGRTDSETYEAWAENYMDHFGDLISPLWVGRGFEIVCYESARFVDYQDEMEIAFGKQLLKGALAGISGSFMLFDSGDRLFEPHLQLYGGPQPAPDECEDQTLFVRINAITTMHAADDELAERVPAYNPVTGTNSSISREELEPIAPHDLN
jgi:hypothetical protein